MYPEIFRIGSFPISSFGLMLVCAFVAAYFQLAWGLKRLRAGDQEDASALLFAAGLSGILGAKIYYAVLYRDWRLLFDRSGLVWYGGFLLGTLVVLLVLRHRKLAPWLTFDAAAPALALGYAIGRIGCFLVGDDYGMPTTLPWGVEFRQGLPPTRADYLRDYGLDLPSDIPDSTWLTVHPTQLYETGLALLICWLGVRLLKRQSRKGGLPAGSTGLMVTALLSVERFGIEFLRAKDDRLLGHFTLAQLIAVVVLGVVTVLWLRRVRRSREASAKVPASTPS